MAKAKKVVRKKSAKKLTKKVSKKKKISKANNERKKKRATVKRIKRKGAPENKMMSGAQAVTNGLQGINSVFEVEDDGVGTGQLIGDATTVPTDEASSYDELVEEEYDDFINDDGE